MLKTVKTTTIEVQGQSEYVDTTANDKNFTGDVAGTFYLKMLIQLRVL